MIPQVDAVETLRFHRFLLKDTSARLHLFEQALAATIQAGDVVLDLGTGTGVLAYFACRAGARRVYAVESEPVVELAKLLAAKNGFEDRIVFIERRSEEVELAEPVDLIVTDTFGTFGFKSGGLRSLMDARRRFLKPGGTMIPQGLELFMVPVETPQAYEEFVAFWDRSSYGIDWSVTRDFAVNNRYPVRLTEDAFLAGPIAVARLDLQRYEDVAVKGEAILTVKRAGTLHGLCGWFRARLSDEVLLDNRPASTTTNYAQTFFPIAPALSVEPGDEMTFRVSAYDGLHWRWLLEVCQAGQPAVRYDHSTFHGFPLSASWLQAPSPE